MKELLEHFFALVLAVIYLTARSIPAAPGQVLELQPATTLAGLKAVDAGLQPFGRVWLNGKGALVAWPQSGGWAWVCLRCQQDAMGLFNWLSGSKGNIASPGTFSELAAWLKAQGWQQTPAVGALSQWINAGANWVSILVLPVIPELLPTESGVRY